ncbi:MULTISPECIES: hypothetical protein [Natrialbaceae]|uniref:hypothetical protein n=1 Tax=Natrialbaceae TaxID=1644061 RepID=UPI00207C2442|nr:hypothetical protein [Natronococcus sp. CG52]
MAAIRQYLYGKQPLRAVKTVVAVGVITAVILVPFGLLERGISDSVEILEKVYVWTVV